ncbi:MAG TPA: hypothetical protein DEP35_05065 [Deltaproteobacteria bacterium]|nr:hypothetical protein [Deltaproteobacteria bacterium]
MMGRNQDILQRPSPSTGSSTPTAYLPGTRGTDAERVRLAIDHSMGENLPSSVGDAKSLSREFKGPRQKALVWRVRAKSGEESRMMSNSTKSERFSESLGRDECLKLLRQGSVGRLAVVIDGKPHVLPLNYAADEDGVIVFRTADLTAATDAALANVAFEVDEIDLARRQGWSVAVHGFAREITEAIDDDSKRLLRMPVHPWAPGQRDRWFKITPKEITGRRLRSTASAS